MLGWIVHFATGCHGMPRDSDRVFSVRDFQLADEMSLNRRIRAQGPIGKGMRLVFCEFWKYEALRRTRPG